MYTGGKFYNNNDLMTEGSLQDENDQDGMQQDWINITIFFIIYGSIAFAK